MTVPASPLPAPEPPRATPARICRLLATAGLLSGRAFTVGPNGLLIGRDPSTCQVVIADDEVSRIHAWIGLDSQGQMVIRDRESANGTFVNREKVRERVVGPEDEIAIGALRQHLFRVEQAVEPAAVAAPSPARRPAKGSTSVLSGADLPAPAAERSQSETVALKLSGLMARPHCELIVDRYAVRTVELPESGLVVGRDPARCQLLLDHPSVSGVHAEIVPRDGKVRLHDRSTNGTFLNGTRVKEAELKDGDYITFGRYAGKSLIFRTGLEPERKLERVDLKKDRITIGRDASSDVCINHPVVSAKHAEIVRQDGKFFIVDLGSTNGTFVNGIKVKRHLLHELDRIVVGPSELRFTGTSLAHSAEGRVVRLDVANVSFDVRDRATGQARRLLDEISLVVKPRELIGLLGPSGAGKSTLMNALNGFVRPTHGRILYNRADLYENLDALKTTIGFVPQEDIMHKQLPVRRCLYYAAKLRLPADLSDPEIYRRVEEMLDILKLDPKCWDNPVATLSGGQRKRVSIGIELLPKPGVLFLDEPTAGLDPRTETLMMMLFRQLANQGATIVITTHLLASFGVLDKVVVLVQGRLAFYGPGTKLLEYFKAESPPDVYDDLTDNNNLPYALELKKRFRQAPLYREVIAEPLEDVEQPAKAGEPPPRRTSEERRFSLHQFKVLAARNWELKFGDRAQTLLLFLQAPLVALLVALMAGGPNQVQTIFMAMFAALWFGCSNGVREIVDEQHIYRRERQTGLKIPSYVFSKLAVLSFVGLVQCVSVILVLLFVNRALSLGPGEILGAVAVMFLVAVNGTLIGLIISSLVNSPEKALTLFPLVLIPELLLSGLFLPVHEIRPLIPLTVEQLMEGQLFAPPAAKTKAEEAMKPPSPEEEIARGGEAAHQVVGAIRPSEEVEETFHKYTPQPVSGMPTAVRWLSALAVSRWGLEALADLCLHGRHSTQDYAYKIINSVSMTLHPEDMEQLERGLEMTDDDLAAAAAFPLPSDFWRDKGPYFGVLTAFLLAGTLAVLFLVKRKDVK